MTEPAFLGIRASARRVQRSRRTIQRWLRQGMPYIQFEGRKMILEQDLLSTYRTKLLSNPTRKRRPESA
jgi:predicted site-specific integrase-resolvase